MKNTYVFIIWDKALFCSKQILRDLSNDFEIVNKFYVDIPKENFKESLLAFYGTKASDLDRKIYSIGVKKFLVVVIKDHNPSFSERKTYNGNELVNNNLYDKKWLYRKWTAGNFRIHSSQTEEETKHDLTILLSNNYAFDLQNIKPESLISKQTLVKNNYLSFIDFKETINNICKANIVINKNKIIVFAQNKKSVQLFLNNSFVIIGDIKYDIVLFGVDENEIPIEIFYNEKMANDFIGIMNDYNHFLSTKKITNNLKYFSNQYSFSLNREIIDTMRPSSVFTIKDKINISAKYYIKRFLSIL